MKILLPGSETGKQDPGGEVPRVFRSHTKGTQTGQIILIVIDGIIFTINANIVVMAYLKIPTGWECVIMGGNLTLSYSVVVIMFIIDTFTVFFTIIILVIITTIINHRHYVISSDKGTPSRLIWLVLHIYSCLHHKNWSTSLRIAILQVFDEAVRAVLRPQPIRKRQRKCSVL